MNMDQADDINRLFVAAVEGSTDAQLRLVDMHLEAWTEGTVGQLEALTKAETWARFAATSGRADAITALADVFTARATFDGLRGLTDMAEWYETEARRRRESAGSSGHNSETPSPITGPVDPDSPTALHDGYVAAAAKGSASALTALFDDTVQHLVHGRCEAIEALAATEIMARIGAARADPGSLARLAGVLGRRATYEIERGNGERAIPLLSEALVLISMLADNGDHEQAARLSALVEDLTAGGVVPAIMTRPSILAHVRPQGCT